MKILIRRQGSGSKGGATVVARQTGFTLIELVIAIAIVGILSAVAVTTYEESVRKSNRKAAASCLQEQAQLAERIYTTTMSYATVAGANTGCAADLAARYQFTATNVTATTYTVNAIARGAQLTDSKCLNLGLTQTGQKTVTGSYAATPNDCWTK
jgi:type IV pilus assembly protein PilE